MFIVCHSTEWLFRLIVPLGDKLKDTKVLPDTIYCDIIIALRCASSSTGLLLMLLMSLFKRSIIHNAPELSVRDLGDFFLIC